MSRRPPMPRMVARTCGCGVHFEARAADVNRGWGRYCSKRCKAQAQPWQPGEGAKPAADPAGHLSPAELDFEEPAR